MNQTEKFDILTATEADLAAHVEAILRSKALNHIEKAELRRDLRFRLTSDGQLMYRSGYPNTPENAAAVRRFVEAQLAWLTRNEGDDLTPARVGQCLAEASKDLLRIQSLRSAVNWVEECEQDGSEVSPTLKNLRRRLDDAIKEASDEFSKVLTVSDMAVLSKINSRTWRCRRRFRLQMTWRDWGMPEQFLALYLTPGIGRYEFARMVESAKTLSEVKALCAIWRMPVKAVDDEFGRKIVGENFEVIPV